MKNNTPKNQYKVFLLSSLILVFLIGLSPYLMAQVLEINATGKTTFSGSVTIRPIPQAGAPTPVASLRLRSSYTGLNTGLYITQGSYNSAFYHNENGDFILRKGNQTNQLVLDVGGSVGIGTTNPTKGKLQVEGVSNYTYSGNYYAYIAMFNGSPQLKKYNRIANVTIWASNRIVCGEINSFSDARIKNIQGVSDSRMDLQTIRTIEITDYTPIDIIEKGNKPSKKVIAQQLAKVYPQAVNSTFTEVIPDIYQCAKINSGWVQLETNLQAGERVKLLTENSTEVYEVLQAEPTRFQIQLETSSPNPEAVFVYGREVNDFHAVDYDAISMLNVSATQELAKQVEALQQENDKKDAEITALKAQQYTQALSLESLKTSIARLQILMQNRTATPDELVLKE